MKDHTDITLAKKADFTHTELTIEWDKQGKHIRGHNNFIELKSELTHPDPQKLIERYAGKGIPTKGEKGLPGYQEIFETNGEIIGYYKKLNPDGSFSVPIATTRGKIHYSKTGAHIVPAAPKKP